MKFVRTINQVQYSENTVYGNRACDLAHLAAERVKVPETYVVSCDAWELFFKPLKYKIDFVLQQIDISKPDTLASAYNSIRRLILNERVPDAVMFELKEAYESFGVGIGVDEMTKDDTSPFTLMISSPDYVAEAESYESIIQNIRTMEEISIAFKEIYAMQYTPEAIRYRSKIGVRDFRCALILQKMPEHTASATAYSTDPEQQDMVFVQAYKGFTDIRDLVAKDFFHVKKDYLTISGSQIVEQSKIVDREDGELIPQEFASRGQKMNDKEVMEVARLAKKSEKILGNPVKLIVGQADDFYVLWANRYEVPNRRTPESMTNLAMTVEEAVSQGESEMHTTALNQTQESEPDEVLEAEPSEADFVDAEESDDDTEEAEPEPVSEDDDEHDDTDEFEKDDAQDDFIEYDEKEDELDQEFDEEPSQEPADEFIEMHEEPEDDSEEYVKSPEYEEPHDDETEEDSDQYEDSEDDTQEEDSDEYVDDDSDDEEYHDESNQDETEDDADEYVDDSEEEPEDDSEYQNETEEDSGQYEDDSEDDPQEKDSDEYEDDSEEEPEDDYEKYEDSEEKPATEPFDEQDSQEDLEDNSRGEDTPAENFDEADQPVPETPGTEHKADEINPEDAEIINKSVRIIYSELSKRYEESGEQAPDTITELISQGVQKNVFNVEGLSDVLTIKRKVRSGEPVSEEEKNHVLNIVNQLV